MRSSSIRIISNFLCAVLLTLPAFEANAEETWLAVGYGGRRMVSTDGANWKITAEWAQQSVLASPSFLYLAEEAQNDPQDQHGVRPLTS